MLSLVTDNQYNQWWYFLKFERHIVPVNAMLTRSTKLPSTKRAKKGDCPREEESMTENNKGSADRPSPFSERMLRSPKRMF